MKTIRNMPKRITIKKNLYKLIFTFIFTSVIVLTVPGGVNKVYAAPLEDCDLDGFDDATGVPVPWPGYDETKGDTPDGPAGSKVTPTTAPASTTEGSKDSVTPGKTNSSDTDKTDSTKTNNTNSGSTTKTDSTNSSKTNSNTQDKTTGAVTDKTSSTTSSNTKSTTTDKTSKTDSDTTSSAEKSNTTKTESVKESNSTSVNTSNNVSDKISDTANDDGNKAEAITNTTSSAADESNAGNPSTLSTEENNQGENTQGENQQSDVNLDNGENENIAVVNTDGTIDDFEAVINTKGTLDIAEVSGSIVHVGSSVNIFGSGFAGNVQNLEIQIQSESKQLGNVNSSEDGSFEAQFSIPDDIEAGTHNIVVLYEGTEISRQLIDIGPKAADSFLQALTVGFSSDNKGLVPGLFLLLGLFAVGVGAIGFNALIRPRQYKAKG